MRHRRSRRARAELHEPSRGVLSGRTICALYPSWRLCGASKQHACAHVVRDGTPAPGPTCGRAHKCFLTWNGQKNNMQRTRTIDKRGLPPGVPTANPTRRKSRSDSVADDRQIPHIEKESSPVDADRAASRYSSASMGFPWRITISWWHARVAYAQSARGSPTGRYASIIVTRRGRYAGCFVSNATACLAFPETTLSAWQRGSLICAPLAAILRTAPPNSVATA